MKNRPATPATMAPRSTSSARPAPRLTARRASLDRREPGDPPRSNALRLETYIQDATREGGSELAGLFRKAQADSRKGAEKGKQTARLAASVLKLRPACDFRGMPGATLFVDVTNAAQRHAVIVAHTAVQPPSIPVTDEQTPGVDSRLTTGTGRRWR